MADSHLTTLKLVAEAINFRFELEARATVEYPDFIAIPEKNVNDDVSESENHWAVGFNNVGIWTGNLVRPDGADCGEYAFAVRPKSDKPEDIADAIYCHGIGDLYLGGGCSDANCPRVRA